MRNLAILLFPLAFFACDTKPEKQDAPVKPEETTSPEPVPENRIPVLNFGTFHMGFTTDEHKTEFDENDKKNQEKVHDIAAKLASFKPTVIIVEMDPKYNDYLQKEYQSYIQNPDTMFADPSEIELLAYEIGRLAGTSRIYGIDHKMGYNYAIGFEIENHIDSNLHNAYYDNPLQFYPDVNVNLDSLELEEKLKLYNQNQFLDFLITVNADALTFVGSENGFEGADEAAKYYQRNLRMFSNLNRIELYPDDRVFILMGASHTAFFRDFISRSPKYYMVNTFDYLNN